MHESGRPQIVAHRGASELLPEHTVAAYAAALDQGADALECDVRLTADRELVCIHDRTVDRTSSGTGVVSRMSLAELNRLDFSSWKRGAVPGAGVLTLRRLLELVADHDRPVELAVETKHPLRQGAALEGRLAELLRELGMQTKGSPVRVMSFSVAALVRARRLLPDLDAVFLFDKPSRLRMAERLLDRGWLAGPGLQLITARPELVERLAEHGRRVHVWTADAPEDWDLLCDLDVGAIITNRPGSARAHLVGSGRRYPS